jgi:hypothetical protein
MWKYGVCDRLLFFVNAGAELIGGDRAALGPIDKIIWLFPEPYHRETLLKLHDIGVTVICAGESRISGISDYYLIPHGDVITRTLRERLFRSCLA